MYLFDADFFFFSTAVRKLDIVYKAYSLKIQLVLILQDSTADLLRSKSYKLVLVQYKRDNSVKIRSKQIDFETACI